MVEVKVIVCAHDCGGKMTMMYYSDVLAPTLMILGWLSRRKMAISLRVFLHVSPGVWHRGE